MNCHGGTFATNKSIVDFSASTSPLSIHPAAREELKKRALFPGDESGYPESDALKVRSLLGTFWDFDWERIIVGSGAVDIIYAISFLVVRDDSFRAVIFEPAFSEYESSLLAAGMGREKIMHCAVSDSQSIDFSFVRAVFLASPSNPDGRVSSFDEILRIERACEKSGALFVLDACFAQFSSHAENILRRIVGEKESFKNLVVLNAFTKFYGLAGMRLGYALCFDGAFSSALGGQMRPWATGNIAQKCAAAVLIQEISQLEKDGTSRWVESVRALVEEEKNRFYALFDSAHVSYKKSGANFILFMSVELSKVVRNEGLVSVFGSCALRNCRDFFGLDESWFRIGIKSKKENDVLLKALSGLFLGGAECAGGEPAKKARVLMVQGTMSNAGKSILVAALCRIFRKDGFRVAPIKSQNMALNSGVTADGLEMGRAQMLQAQAALIEPDVRMNPILLKPSGDSTSQVIVNGEVLCTMSAKDYFSYRKSLVPAIMAAFGSLSAENDIIVVEGAGSPAEINLRENDIVNMGLAELLDAPVVLCGDIDRGGVFASLYGTCALVSPSERERIKGFVINKFRGDVGLLQDGLDQIQSMTDIPVLGVVPFIPELRLDDEDSLSERLLSPVEKHKEETGAKIVILILKLPYISNFTDFDALCCVPGVLVRFFEPALEYGRIVDFLGIPDLIVIPGTKNSVRAMTFLHESGLSKIIRSYARERPVIGICGGFQLLGEFLHDAEGNEDSSRTSCMEALSLLPVETFFTREKTRRRVSDEVPPLEGFFSALSGKKIVGYEIHQGRTARSGGGELGACVSSGFVLGTYAHGFFDSPELLCALLGALCVRRGIPPISVPNVSSLRERELSRLEMAVRRSVDMEKIYSILGISPGRGDL